MMTGMAQKENNNWSSFAVAMHKKRKRIMDDIITILIDG